MKKIVLLLLLVGCTQINSFEECAKAGNPIMESFPEQCSANGKTFIKEYPEWQLDQITLMQSKEGYGCFGCNKTLCIDPMPGLEVIKETEKLHCNLNFKIN
tara:strand:+ start:1054 stop:1356 length:303 start_codon:yes stop_codon:yes gene_type:complete